MRTAYFCKKLFPFAFALLGLCQGCALAPARPQLVVTIDTDAPLTLQAASDPRLSLDAAIDRVRVEQLDKQGNIENVRVFTAPSTLDWPISFGLVSAGPVTLRIRAYRALDAQPATSAGALYDVPDPSTTIDRLVTLTGPAAGVEHASILLRSECFNAPASLLEPRTTCVDAAHRRETPGDHVSEGGDSVIATRAGTWVGAQEIACKGTATADRVCIPGGFSRIGNNTNVQLLVSTFELPVAPARPVRVSPFFLDRTEFTVGRARRWLPSLKSIAPLNKQGTGTDILQDCTLTDSPDSDALPLNCVMASTAQELCEREGGTLPSEAQWNHAATGRGQRRRFAWGDDSPTCCTTSASRVSALRPDLATCKQTGAGPEPVGSHAVSAACPTADVSRDGILDLGGSVAEILADDEDSLDGPCWSTPGVLIDPVCRNEGRGGRVVRGSSYDAGLLTTLVARRSAVSSTNNQARAPYAGFRCAYPDR